MKELENIDERKFDNSDELWNFIVSLLDIIDDKDESDRNKIERLEIISKLLLDNQVDNIDLVNIKNKSLTKQLPYFKGIIPKNYLIPNNKIIQKLSEIMEAREKGRNLLVSAKKSKKPIIAHCLIAYDQKSVNLNTKITEFDLIVYNAITSIVEAGGTDTLMTPENIHRVMTGEKDSATPSRHQVEQVIQSIDKMRFCRAIIDCTEEVVAYNKFQNIAEYDSLQHKKSTNGELRYLFDTYLLASQWCIAACGNDEVRALRLLSKPVLAEYAKISGQILNIPSYLLNTKHIQANTQKNIILKDYLLRRIEQMKGNNNLEQKTISLLSYDRGNEHHKGLYEIITGKAENDMVETKRIRQASEKYLTYWKECKYIKNFHFEKSGRTFSTINILL